MPTDPKTGERLPGKAGLYAGEPGAPADAPPTPDTVVPERDLKPGADELDAITAGVEPGGEELLAEDEMVEGEVEEEVVEEGAPDLGPLMDMLGATEERAQMLYDAAQELGKTQGKTPEELAKMIVDDFDILMQLEMIAARGEGGAMGAPPAEMAPPPVEMPGAAPAEMEGM